MSKVFVQGMVVFLVIFLGAVAGFILSGGLSTYLPSLEDRLSPQKPSPAPIEEQTRILTPDEQVTMSGSFQKEFQLILASGSGNQR